MYENFLDLIIEKTQSKLINSMVQSEINILENNLMRSTADKAADICEDTMIDRLTDLFLMIED